MIHFSFIFKVFGNLLMEHSVWKCRKVTQVEALFVATRKCQKFDKCNLTSLICSVSDLNSNIFIKTMAKWEFPIFMKISVRFWEPDQMSRSSVSISTKVSLQQPFAIWTLNLQTWRQSFSYFLVFWPYHIRYLKDLCIQNYQILKMSVSNIFT